MRDEVWKPIRGYEGLYSVSDCGSVKNDLKNRFLKVTITDKGYGLVGLRKDGKTTLYQVHRLVAEAFVPNPKGFPEVNHKDENKMNNSVENLEWCDRKYNFFYGTARQRNADSKSKPIVQIDDCGNVVKEWKSATEASQYGFDQKNICACLHGKRKTHKGFKWKFL